MSITATELKLGKYLQLAESEDCLLYTSDAADDGYSVDLGGRRIIKKIFFKQKTAYEISEGLVGSEMCIRDSTNSSIIIIKPAYPSCLKNDANNFKYSYLSLIHI